MNHARFLPLALLALSASTVVSLGSLGCSSKSAAASADAGDDGAPPPAQSFPPGNTKYEQPGPYPVGHTTFTLVDATRSRTMSVEVWYPADESARAAATTGIAMEDFVPAGADHDALAGLIAKSPGKCVRKRTSSAADAMPVAASTIAKWPTLAFSHCHDGMRFAAFTIAERLASHGFAVVAPDHTGNTIFDHLAGHEISIGQEFLQTRVGDVEKVLDTVLDDTSMVVPASVRGRFDATKVGMYGHSYGSATTGATAAIDPRVKAALGIAAPWESIPFMTKMANIHVPAMFLLMQEDNSITEIGNNVMRDNFMHATPSWLVEVVDAGHWSVTDIAGLSDASTAGCGTAQRQTDSYYAFNYLDNDSARGLGASYVTAFFASTLGADADATAFIESAHPDKIAVPSHR